MFLSALLNVIHGVASPEGRVLIMTTNHITRLDEALVRTARMDRKVELGLADKKMTANICCVVFKAVEGDVTHPSRREEVETVERFPEEFTVRVPELKFYQIGCVRIWQVNVCC